MTSTVAAGAASRIALVASDSVSGLRYEVTLPTGEGQQPRCECPAFRYRNGGEDDRGNRSCKHIRAAASRRVVWTAEHVAGGRCRSCGAPAAAIGPTDDRPVREVVGVSR